jgi:hypothetical protein
MTKRKFLQENERKFRALLYALRKQIYVPDEVDHHYIAWLGGLTAAFAVAYRALLKQQMTLAIELEVRIFTITQKEFFEVMTRYGTEKVFNVEKMVGELFDRTLPRGYTLSDRIWDLKNYSNDIRAVLENGIRNNMNPQVIARQLEGFLNPDRLAQATPYGRSLSYDSMRLARNEVLHAGREFQREQARNAPWITGIDWVLSANHSALCDCDDYAAHGTYRVEDVPLDPHPQCQCSLEEVSMTPEEFSGALRDYLSSGEDRFGIEDWLEARKGVV